MNGYILNMYTVLHIYGHIAFFLISALEDQCKKKEFDNTLECKVDVAVQELDNFKKKCELLQKQNIAFFLVVI